LLSSLIRRNSTGEAAARRQLRLQLHWYRHRPHLCVRGQSGSEPAYGYDDISQENFQQPLRSTWAWRTYVSDTQETTPSCRSVGWGSDW